MGKNIRNGHWHWALSVVHPYSRSCIVLQHTVAGPPPPPPTLLTQTIHSFPSHSALQNPLRTQQVTSRYSIITRAQPDLNTWMHRREGGPGRGFVLRSGIRMVLRCRTTSFSRHFTCIIRKTLLFSKRSQARDSRKFSRSCETDDLMQERLIYIYTRFRIDGTRFSRLKCFK